MCLGTASRIASDLNQIRPGISESEFGMAYFPLLTAHVHVNMFGWSGQLNRMVRFQGAFRPATPSPRRKSVKGHLLPRRRGSHLSQSRERPLKCRGAFEVSISSASPILDGDSRADCFAKNRVVRNQNGPCRISYCARVVATRESTGLFPFPMGNGGNSPKRWRAPMGACHPRQARLPRIPLVHRKARSNSPG